jgi:hypothetical protein
MYKRTENCGEKVFWPSHKHIDMYTRDLVHQLRDSNIYQLGKWTTQLQHSLTVFLKLKVKRRCRAIEGIPGDSRDSFMQRPKEILL